MRLFSASKSMVKKERRPVARRTRRMVLAAGLAGLVLAAGLVGTQTALSRLKHLDYITWNDLVEDYDGDYNRDGFTNGTFASYDSVHAAKLPSLILVKDRIERITPVYWDTSHCYLPARPSGCGERYVSVKLESTPATHPSMPRDSGDFAVAGELDTSTMLRFREGSEIVIRLQVIDYWSMDGMDVYWPVESFSELSADTGLLAPSALSPPEPGTLYTHRPLTHPAPGARRPISGGLLRPIAHDVREGGVTVTRIDHQDRWRSGRLDLGSMPLGSSKVFSAALGIVNEEESAFEFYGGNVTGDIQFHLDILLHNRTYSDASSDGGVPIWVSGPTSTKAQWRLAPGDRDARQAHGVPTPVNSITGIRWMPSEDDASGTDTVWLEVAVHTPPGSTSGTFTGKLSLSFKSVSDLRDTQYVRISFGIMLVVE